MAALEYIARYTDAGYDHVVFDTAPTGHTLRLLDLPNVLGETLGVAGEVQRRVQRTARAARSMVFGPAAYWGSGDDSEGSTNDSTSRSDRFPNWTARRRDWTHSHGSERS